MRRGLRSLLSAAAAATAAGVFATAQSPAPTLRIIAPKDGEYVSGPTRLVAAIDPLASTSLVTEVVFFADGKQTCTVRRPPFECDWDAGEQIVDHTIRATAVLRSGNRLVDTITTKQLESYVETVDVDVIQITAVVTDSDGRFVTGLTEKDFRVFEDDKPQRITGFASENIPLELVTAIDVSSSMRDALPAVKEAAKRFLAGLRPGDQTTVLGFNENIFIPVRRETNQAARIRAIDRLGAWGGTALYDAIIQAVNLLGRQQGRRAIVLFTDGDDQDSHASMAAAIARTEETDATIYAIGQGRAVRTTVLQKLIRQLTSASGGRPFFSDDVQKLDADFKEILEDLRHQYMLSYPPPNIERNGVYHRIKVEAGRGKYRVRAQQGYRLKRR
jgi:VWFA-related protein